MMAEAYIVGALRTATGKNRGRLSQIHPVDLGATLVDGLLDQVGIDPEKVDDLIATKVLFERKSGGKSK